MDQVRAIAKVIWEQRFWVLSVLGLIVALVCWNMASGSLDARFSERKSAIDGMFTAIQGLKSKPVHPNQIVNEEDQKQVAQQTEYVNEVWQELYNRQKESVLKWPQELGPQFLAYIEGMKFRDPISSNMRSVYQNYIDDRFDGLLKIADAQKLAEGSSGGAYGGGGQYGRRGEYSGGGPVSGTPSADEDYLVQWLDQDKVRAKLAFATNKPTSLQIWVTQEDLWVYEAILNVIAKTNKERGATRPDNTAIRTIIALEVGAGASQGMGQALAKVYMPQAGGDAGAMAGGEPGGGGRGDYPGETGGAPYTGGESYAVEGADPSAVDAALLTSRYLDDTGAPLAGDGDLGKEYRQLPIRMELVMDQRYIPQMLVECANSPLPIEVKQLRINPDKALAGFEGMGGSMGMSSNPALSSVTDPNFAMVEVKGVVFIYNDPAADPSAVPVSEDGQIAAGP
jgi:hypothetical protein